MARAEADLAVTNLGTISADVDYRAYSTFGIARAEAYGAGVIQDGEASGSNALMRLR